MKKSDFLSFLTGAVGGYLFTIGAFMMILSEAAIESSAFALIGLTLIPVAAVIHQILDKQESAKRKKN